MEIKINDEQITKRKIQNLFIAVYYEAADNDEQKRLSIMAEELNGLKTQKEIEIFIKKYDIKKLLALNN